MIAHTGPERHAGANVSERGDQLDAAATHWPRLIALHLGPGALIALGFVVLAPAVQQLGAPANLALLLAMLLVGIPIELGVLLRRRAELPGRPPLSAVIGYRERLPRRQAVPFVIGLFVWSVVAYSLLAPLAEWLRETAFGWWPAELSLGSFAGHLDGYDGLVVWCIVGLSLVLNVTGPLVEELYFRGYLMPRMEDAGEAAPVLSTVLFSLYHFWLPWEFFSRIAALLPAVWVVYRKRDIRMSIWVHVLLNTTGSIGLLALALTRA